MSGEFKKNRYIFFERNLKSKAIVSIQEFKTEKTQEEISEMLLNYNEKATVYTLEKIPLEMVFLADLALKWKNTVTLSDIKNQLYYIHNEVENAASDIEDFIREQKK